MSFQGNSIFWVEVDKIVPNPYQPRREFNEHSLKELSESIRMYGILQPLTVSRKEVIREDGTFFTQYELIAGERRLRASKLAGLEQVPVIIREGEDSEQEKLELAIIENLQREDLNAVDRAMAFKQLADTFGLSHAQVAGKVGRSREYVSNSIRLLNLPEHMINAVKKGDINEGHGRTLLMLNDRPEEQDTVFREIMLKKLSVREVERIARKIATDKVRKKDWLGSDPELIEIEKQFTESLGTRVQIQKTDFGGKVTIDYFSQEDLEIMLARLRVLDAEKESLQQSQTEMDTLTKHTGLDVAPEVDVPDIVQSQTQAPARVAEEMSPAVPMQSPQPEYGEERIVVNDSKVEEVSAPRSFSFGDVAQRNPELKPEPEPVPAPSPMPMPPSAPVQAPATEQRFAAYEPHYSENPAPDNSPEPEKLESAHSLLRSETPMPMLHDAPQKEAEIQRPSVSPSHEIYPSPAVPSPVPAHQESSAVPPIETVPAPVVENKKEDDDDDLYSIRNFNV